MNNILDDVVFYTERNGVQESIKINRAKKLSYSDGYHSMLVSLFGNDAEKLKSIFTTNPPISKISIGGHNYKFFKIRKLENSPILYEIIYTDAKK